MKKKLLYFIMLLIAVIYLLLATTIGFKIILHSLRIFLPFNITYHTMTGNLLDGIQISQLSLEQNNFKLRVNKFNFHAQSQALKRRILIKNFDIQDVYLKIIIIKNNINTNQSNTNFINYLKYIALEKLVIENLNVYYGETFYYIKQFHIQNIDDNNYNIILKPLLGQLSGKIFFNRHDPLILQSILTAKNLALTKDNSFPNINGLLDFTFNKNKIICNDCLLTIGSNYLKLDKNNNVIVLINQLSEIIPKVHGKININGHLSHYHEFFGKIKIQDIKSKDFSIKEGHGEFSLVEVKKLFKLSGNLDVNKIRYKQNIINTIKFHLLSTMDNHHSWLHKILILVEKNNLLKITISPVNSKINGKVIVNFSNLQPFLNTHKINLINGKLVGNLSINGEIKKLFINGSLAVNQGKVFIPSANLNIDNINILAEFYKNNDILLKGDFQSGSGKAVVKASTNYRKLLPFQLNLTGNNLRIINLKNYQIDASPQITAVVNAKDVKLNGRVVLPYVNIVHDNYKPVIKLPDEVIIINDPHLVSKALFPDLLLNIELILSEKTSIKYKGLHAKLNGNLHVTKLLGALPTASGTLHIVSGQYRFYNRLLNIDAGRLIYLGNPLTNPGLDIKITQNINTTMNDTLSTFDTAYVGAYVQGTLDEPVTKLLSHPPMSQNEIISYLIFGSDLSNSDSSSFSLITAFASNFNVLGSVLPSFNSSSSGFNINFLDGLNFKYKLTSHFAIKTKANINETSSDLIYYYEHE